MDARTGWRAAKHNGVSIQRCGDARRQSGYGRKEIGTRTTRDRNAAYVGGMIDHPRRLDKRAETYGRDGLERAGSAGHGALAVGNGDGEHEGRARAIRWDAGKFARVGIKRQAGGKSAGGD